MSEDRNTNLTPIMTVKIDPSRIFRDVAVTDPNELSEDWTETPVSTHRGDNPSTTTGDTSERVQPD
jgi:hypothetical protein